MFCLITPDDKSRNHTQNTVGINNKWVVISNPKERGIAKICPRLNAGRCRARYPSEEIASGLSDCDYWEMDWDLNRWAEKPTLLRECRAPARHVDAMLLPSWGSAFPAAALTESIFISNSSEVLWQRCGQPGDRQLQSDFARHFGGG